MKKTVILSLLISIATFLISSKNVYAACDVLISSCSILDQTNKYYCLVRDIINSEASECINMGDNIVLDCQGHTIKGLDRLYSIGIIIGYRKNVTVKNCVLTDWYQGIYISQTENVTVQDSVTNSNYYGIRTTSSSYTKIVNLSSNFNEHGIIISSTYYSQIVNSSSNFNRFGITVESSSNNRIINSSSKFNENFGIALSSSASFNQIISFFSSNNKEGFSITQSSFNQIINSFSANNNFGFYIVASDSNELINLTTYNNSDSGIYFYSSSSNHTLTNVKTYNNTYFGIRVVGYNHVLSNVMSYNNFYGISLSSTNTTVSGGSAHSSYFSDYTLTKGTNNSFIATNFTGTRTIYLEKDTWFNYRNTTDSNIWLKTMPLLPSYGYVLITRRLVKWQQENVTWQESADTSVEVMYNLTGLIPNTKYSIYNGSQLIYTLQTDSSGSLNFTLTIGTTPTYIGVATIPNFPPTLSYPWKFPVSPVYSPAANYFFNITVCDNDGASDISTVLFEWANTNISVTSYFTHNTTCRNYTINRVDLAAGNYNYKWFVKDMSNSWASLSDTYTISKAPNPIDIYLINSTGTYKNQNITASYGTQTTANVTALKLNSGNLILYEDGLQVSNPRTTTLSIGEHSYKGNITGNENYTSNSTPVYYIKVIDTSPPRYSLNSINSSLAGSAVSHNLFWQDNIALSHAIFSFDNCTGSFRNVSAIQLSGNSAWSNFTVVINETVGCKIRWKVFANDTSNNWGVSQEYSYITSSEVYCGNGVCDEGEDCRCQDCSCPGSAGCCGNSCGCPEGYICENNVCKMPSQPSPPPPECPQDFVGLDEEKNITLVVRCINKDQTRNFTFSKFLFYNLTLKANSTVLNFLIKAQRIPESLIDISTRINKKVYYYIEFSKENLNEKSLEKIIARFKVEKSWVYSENINTSTISLYRLSTSWEKLNTYKIDEDSSFLYFESELPGFSLFAIAGEEKIVIPQPQCPVCPEASDWSECKEGKRNRTSYYCSEETNFECVEYVETEECEEKKEEEKKEEEGLNFLYIGLALVAFVPVVLLVLYLRKFFKPKKEVSLGEKEVVCPRCFSKMERTYSGRNIEMYECKKCGYTKPEIKRSYFEEKS